MRDPELWRRLKAHAFDAEQGSAPFSVKLARAEGWTPDHTHAVIAEYRRFVYLCAISETPVTPSEAVDRAWHMHLTFSRDYWDVMCAEVLGKPLHHDPCEGDEDMPRYERQYIDTLALYRAEFGREPPVSVWTSPEAVRDKKGDRAFYLGCTTLSFLALAAVVAGSSWLGWLTFGLAVVFSIWFFLRHPHKGKGGTHGGGGCAAGCGTGCGGGGCGGA